MSKNFDWAEFERVAEELRNKAEAEQRTAISRLYYSVYHKAKDYLISKGIQIPKKSPHYFVWNEFERYDAEEAQDAAFYGKKLRDLRHKVDYAAPPIRLVADVNDGFNSAKKFDIKLEALKANYPTLRLRS